MARTFLTIDIDDDTWDIVKSMADRNDMSPELMCSYLLERHCTRLQKAKNAIDRATRDEITPDAEPAADEPTDAPETP